MSNNNLIQQLKNENQDFEFYPTTQEIINELIKDIVCLKDSLPHYRFSFESFLDIGAGNGKVLNAIKNKIGSAIELYAIEKSNTLKKLLKNNVYIIGTDFKEQSLIDKEMDITFCNPPYKQFLTWSNKIIRETCSHFLYLVIPERWKDSELLKDAINYRECKYNIIGKFDFLNSEDRKARCNVQLVRFEFSGSKSEAFDKLFESEFKNVYDKFENESGEKSNTNFDSLVVGKDYVHQIVSMYSNELKKIKSNYLYVQKLDTQLLKEFEILPDKILKLLKNRINSLKNLYWNELISRMKEITDKLTNKKRKLLIDKLNKNGTVDFTESNIYTVVLWILENSSKYIDEQLIETYENCMSKANCTNYKSNEKVFKYDRWRYNDEKPSHFYLEYRMILTCVGGVSSYYGVNEYRLSERAGDFVRDLLTIANTLGFKCNTVDERLNHYTCTKVWKPGQPQTFDYISNGQTKVLFEAKGHLNGNLHLRLNQDFALALNVEFGRLKGWLHSGKEATQELNNKKANLYFNTSKCLLFNPFAMIEHKKVVSKPVQKVEPKKVIAKQVSLNFDNDPALKMKELIKSMRG